MQQAIYGQLDDGSSVWSLDETGFEKAGKHSVGVQRQYSGTIGKIGNCQVAVFLGLSSTKGYGLLDSRLYLPKSWFANASKFQRSGIPQSLSFKTKPQLAIELVEAQLHSGHRCTWVTGDSVYGNSPTLRHYLESRQLNYVLGVCSKLQVEVSQHQTSRSSQWHQLSRWSRVKVRGKLSLARIAHRIHRKHWHRIQFKGTKGKSKYMWAMVPIALNGQLRTLLVRRLGTDYSFFICYSKKTSLKQLARVAHQRWSIERCFAEAKQEVGLDEYQVRLWKAWCRHILLCLVAFAFLIRCRQMDENISLAATRYLLCIPWITRPKEPDHLWHWFNWRQRHNLKAQDSFSKPRIHAR